MKAELGRFRRFPHLSAVKEGTKLVGMLLNDLKKSRGLSFLARLIDNSVVLAFSL